MLICGTRLRQGCSKIQQMPCSWPFGGSQQLPPLICSISVSLPLSLRIRLQRLRILPTPPTTLLAPLRTGMYIHILVRSPASPRSLSNTTNCIISYQQHLAAVCILYRQAARTWRHHSLRPCAHLVAPRAALPTLPFQHTILDPRWQSETETRDVIHRTENSPTKNLA